MPATVSTETKSKNTAFVIKLSGRVEDADAANLKSMMDKAAESGAKRLALVVDQLEYLSASGVRALVFGKQRLGSDAKVFVVGARAAVWKTIENGCFHQAVYRLSAYDAAQIEG